MWKHVLVIFSLAKHSGQKSKPLRCDGISRILASDATAETEPDVAELKSN